MSVQLIVYPQNFDGTYNAMSTSSTEFIVNGITFFSLGNTDTYTTSSATPYNDVLLNAPPTIPNTWYRFRNNTGGTPDYPSSTGGNLILKSVVGSGSITGVYQRLTNLVIGQQYTLTINLSVATTGTIIIQKADGINIYSGGGGLANVTQIIDVFSAQSIDSTVMIAYVNTIDDTATITDISIQPVVGAVPSGAVQILGNGQVICDLYEDEDIPLSLSVDDFKNVAEKVQSYSKAFNLPSTKRNNRIFNAIFDVTRSYDGIIFNPYKKTQCVLKQDGFILFEGYLRMLDVTDKEGEISYNVNLYSEVIALADFLGDRSFRDLDFTELEHDYNRTQITRSWNDGTIGFTTPITWTNASTSGYRTDFETLKYPFVDWTHQILVGGSTPGNAATVGNPELTSLEAAFRPFISIKYLLDIIFEASPFTYESNFFNTTDIKNLYMDFNWGSAGEIIEGSGSVDSDPSNLSDTVFKNLQLQAGFTDFPLEFGYSPTNFNFVAANDGTQYTFDYSFTVYMYSSDDLSFRWQQKDSSGNVIGTFDAITYLSTAVTPLTYKDYVGNITAILAAGDTIQPVFKTGTAGTGTQGVLSFNVTTFVNATTGALVINSNILLQTLRGELGQWDFLKGIITMFNLVTLVDEDNPNNILIEPYTDVFIPTATSGTTLANRGIQHDWTDKIDVSEMKLTPLTDLNRKTIFKFVEDDEDYSFNQYKNSVGGHLYGSKKFNAGNEFNILDGEDEIVAEPFAATVVKALMSQFPSFVTPAIYSYDIDDDTSSGFDNSPRIMYNNGIKPTGTTYYIPEQNGVTSSNEPDYLKFSHLKEGGASITAARDFHFGECQLMNNQASTVFNLFNLYWLPYYSELYNPNTRIMTIKVNLNPADINTFRFNDTVFIKNRIFRVNKIDYKPNDLATVEFILIP